VPRILSISRNSRLLATRNDALAMAGYSVASPKDPLDAIAQFARSRFDAVIIGHSVEIDLRMDLIEGLHELRSKVPILFAHAAGTESEPLADVTVDTADDPFAIIVALDKLLGRTSSGRP
jgi:DNA-binding response OmpR family regulator